MLKLINIGFYLGNGASKSSSDIIKEIVGAINDNSEKFSAEQIYNGTSATVYFNCKSSDIEMSHLGLRGNPQSCGFTVAIDDDKDFIMVIPRIVLNTQTETAKEISGISTSNVTAYPTSVLLCFAGKDLNGIKFSTCLDGDKFFGGGLSNFLDIGQYATSDFTTEGEFILRQGASRGHIVPELFFSMTRLGSCGDIIEKDGHQYTCIAGPIFYKIS